MTALLGTPLRETTRPPVRAPRRRAALVTAALGTAVLAVVVATVCLGTLTVSLPDAVRTVLGGGTRFTDLVVLDLRLPRAVLAVLAGAALALSGGLFQTLLRNELASPDVLGVTGGASVATVAGSLLLGWSGPALSGLAAVGALVVAAAIAVLAPRGGGTGLVLTGVAVGFLVTAALGWVLTRADVQQAQVALAALVGGVGDATWAGNALAAASLAVLLPAVAAAAPTLRALQLDDDTATGLGVRVRRDRTALLGLAVLLAAVGVAAAGPLTFVALVAAPVARRLVGGSSPALLPAALVGALVVLLADTAGQHLVPGVQVPAGVLTGAVGAPWLLRLLARGGS